MAGTARMIPFAVLAAALAPSACGCISADGLDTTLTKLDGTDGVTPLNFPYCRLVTPLPPPTGFSSTYQKYVVDQQRLARQQREQYAQAMAATNVAAANDRPAQSQ